MRATKKKFFNNFYHHHVFEQLLHLLLAVFIFFPDYQDNTSAQWILCVVSNRWNIVVHGAIRGYSRLIAFLRGSTNNRADTGIQGTYWSHSLLPLSSMVCLRELELTRAGKMLVGGDSWRSLMERIVTAVL